MHQIALGVLDHGKAARQHASVAQRRQQLARLRQAVAALAERLQHAGVEPHRQRRRAEPARAAARLAAHWATAWADGVELRPLALDQPRDGRRQPFGARIKGQPRAIDRLAQPGLGPHRQIAKPLASSVCRRCSNCGPSRGSTRDRRDAPVLHRVAQAAEQVARRMVEPLALRRDQIGRPRQAGRRGAQPVARAAGDAPRRLALARAQVVDIADQLGAHRHGGLGGGRGRRRAHVGGIVDQRRVGLVADRRDDRECRWPRRRGPPLPR